MNALEIKEYSGLTFPQIAERAGVGYQTAFHGVHSPAGASLETFTRIMATMGLSDDESFELWADARRKRSDKRAI